MYAFATLPATPPRSILEVRAYFSLEGRFNSDRGSRGDGDGDKAGEEGGKLHSGCRVRGFWCANTT